MIARALGRLILIPLGLILAVLAAAAVLVTLGLEVTTHALSAQTDNISRLEVLVDLGFRLVTLAAAMSFIPALLIAIAGEVGRVRSVLFYVAGGGISVALVPFITELGAYGSVGAMPARAWTVLATAGFAGGFVYWLVAGRNA